MERIRVRRVKLEEKEEKSTNNGIEEQRDELKEETLEIDIGLELGSKYIEKCGIKTAII